MDKTEPGTLIARAVNSNFKRNNGKICCYK